MTADSHRVLTRPDYVKSEIIRMVALQLQLALYPPTGKISGSTEKSVRTEGA